MLIVYLSLTGNVRRFVEKLKDIDVLEINPYDFSNQTEIGRDFVIIAPTYDDEITNILSELVDYGDNNNYLKGLIGSGDKNFAGRYIFNAKDLSKKYNVPILFSFEKSGTDKDIMQFERIVLKN